MRRSCSPRRLPPTRSMPACRPIWRSCGSPTTKRPRARREFRLAVALEEARLRPQGITGKKLGTGRLNPDDIALLMMLRIRLAAIEDKLRHITTKPCDWRRTTWLWKAAFRRRHAPQGSDERAAGRRREPMNQRQPEKRRVAVGLVALQAGVALGNANHLDEAAAQFQAGYMVGRRAAEYRRHGAAGRAALPSRPGAGESFLQKGRRARGPTIHEQNLRRRGLAQPSSRKRKNSAERFWRARTVARAYDLLMELDDELCLCFHVTQRKVVNYLRVEKPRRVGQLSDCFGAGTGCGWCRPFLKRLFDTAGRRRRSSRPPTADRRRLRPRAQQLRPLRRRNSPPGATPIDEAGDGK